MLSFYKDTVDVIPYNQIGILLETSIKLTILTSKADANVKDES